MFYGKCKQIKLIFFLTLFIPSTSRVIYFHLDNVYVEVECDGKTK